MDEAEITELIETISSTDPTASYLNELKNHHRETYEHSRRVAYLSVDVGTQYEIEHNDLERLVYSSLLHDIGKLEISKDILDKPGELTPHEQTEIDKHTDYGRDIVRDAGLHEISDIVASHHDFHYNSDDTPTTHPQLTEILAAADVYDALSSNRSYKDAMPQDTIEKIMHEEHTFDTELINTVLQRGEHILPESNNDEKKTYS